MRARVVGAGVIGLTSAALLARRGHSVELIARQFAHGTASHAACAVWLPVFTGSSQSGLDVHREWASTTFRYLSREPATAGVQALPLLRLGRTTDEAPNVDPNLVGLHRVRLRSSILGIDVAWRLKSFVIDMSLYLPYLRTCVEQLGVEVILGETVGSLHELATKRGPVDVLVNCAGLGAVQLGPDANMSGVKGVLLMGQCPPEPMTGALSFGSYVLAPRNSSLVRGALYKEEYASELVESEEVEQLLAFHQKWPDDALRLIGVRSAELPSDAVRYGATAGLRPVRLGGPRVEAELPRAAGQPLVVHNYGHGGAGVTLSWGCAEAVVGLVEDAA